MNLTVGELGEEGMLERILRRLKPAENAVVGPGDDCAVLQFSGLAAVTSDTMIEGHDFRLDWHTGEELGWKLAVTNLSDVAAMGATPLALTVSLACPPSTEVALLEGITEGLQSACTRFAPGCSVVGGDLATARDVVAAVTAMGDHGRVAPVLRSGANVGDTVAYAGELGLSRIGLRALLEFGEKARESHPVAVRAHLTPHSPIELGRQAAVAGATAMMDVSDGLSLDAARIGRASDVTLDLSTELLVGGFGEQFGVPVAVEDLVFGGEDHGFLATFPAGQGLPAGFLPIGQVVARSESLLLDGASFKPRGWDSLAHE